VTNQIEEERIFCIVSILTRLHKCWLGTRNLNQFCINFQELSKWSTLWLWNICRDSISWWLWGCRRKSNWRKVWRLIRSLCWACWYGKFWILNLHLCLIRQVTCCPILFQCFFHFMYVLKIYIYFNVILLF